MKLTFEEFEKELLFGERFFIPLGKGYFAEVDKIDYEYLINLCNWTFSYKHAQATKKGNHILMHLEIAKRMGLNTSNTIDHKNEDKLDNKRMNLREATYSQQKMNSKIRKDNKIGYKGVSLNKDKNKYQAQICVNNKDINLGSYHDPKDAYIEYCIAAFYYYGEYANYG